MYDYRSYQEIGMIINIWLTCRMFMKRYIGLYQYSSTCVKGHRTDEWAAFLDVDCCAGW
jgi:hypothetical protein